MELWLPQKQTETDEGPRYWRTSAGLRDESVTCDHIKAPELTKRHQICWSKKGEMLSAFLVLTADEK